MNNDNKIRNNCKSIWKAPKPHPKTAETTEPQLPVHHIGLSQQSAPTPCEL